MSLDARRSTQSVDYLVRWLDHDEDNDSWVFEIDLNECMDIVTSFHLHNTSKLMGSLMAHHLQNNTTTPPPHTRPTQTIVPVTHISPPNSPHNHSPLLAPSPTTSTDSNRTPTIRHQALNLLDTISFDQHRLSPSSPQTPTSPLHSPQHSPLPDDLEQDLPTSDLDESRHPEPPKPTFFNHLPTVPLSDHAFIRSAVLPAVIAIHAHSRPLASLPPPKKLPNPVKRALTNGFRAIAPTLHDAIDTWENHHDPHYHSLIPHSTYSHYLPSSLALP